VQKLSILNADFPESLIQLMKSLELSSQIRSFLSEKRDTDGVYTGEDIKINATSRRRIPK